MQDHLGRVVCELVALRQHLGELQAENDSLRAYTEDLSAFMTLAFRDPLTGLRNRRYFETRLGEEIERSRRSESGKISLLMIDIDDFKLINDQRGHQAGDRALRWVATFLRDNVRHQDICCRTGGDEFTVILPDTDHRNASHLIRRLRRRLARELLTSGLEHRVELSIGAATLRPEEPAPELFRRADQAMYQDKAWHKPHTRV